MNKNKDNENFSNKYQNLISKFFPKLYLKLWDKIKYDLSYSELSKLYLPQMFIFVCDDLLFLNNDTLPHETKILRKQIATLRDFLDLFVYVYDFNEKYDIWKELRNNINDWYSFIWDFKDFYDIQDIPKNKAIYDNEQIKNYRKKILNWKKRLLDPKKYNLYLYYLNSEYLNNSFNRDKKNIFKFWWWGVDFKPNLKNNNLTEFSLFEKKLIDNALLEFEIVEKINNLDSKKNINIFHNFRKRLRFIVRIIDYFPYIIDDRMDCLESIEKLNIIVSEYWVVNDKISKLNYYKKLWNKTDLIKQEIVDEFNRVKNLEKELLIRENLLIIYHKLYL